MLYLRRCFWEPRPVPALNLEGLLSELFTAEELRRFLSRLPEGQKLVDSLPEKGGSKAEFVHQAANRLLRRGMVKPFLFEALRAEFSFRKADIDATEQACGAGPTTAPSPEEQDYREEVQRRVERMPWLSKQLGFSRALSAVTVAVKVQTHYEGEQNLQLREVLEQPERRWMLIGVAGSGKTTLLRQLARELAEEEKMLPLLLHVEHLRSHADLLEAAAAAGWGEEAQEVIQQARKQGRLVLLADGLDEARPPLQGPEGVEAALNRHYNQLRSRRTGHPSNMLLLTTRPVAYEEALLGRQEGPHVPVHPDAMSCAWEGYDLLEVRPLEPEEQEKLLRKLGVAEEQIQKELPLLRADRRLSELAGRPLLLTLVALVLRRQGTLPKGRAKLYKEALHCLLRRQELNPGLAPASLVRAPEEVERILEFLAPRLLLKGPGPYPKREVQDLLDGYRPNNTLFKETWGHAHTFLEETARTVGILVQSGVGANEGYVWSHRTLAEYLASRGLVLDTATRRAAVEAGLQNPALWAEVLALTVGQLSAKEADDLVQAIGTGEASRPLLHRVIADAEGLKPETVQGVLGLERGWDRWRARQTVIQDLPMLVGDPAVAVRLLDRFRQETTDGNDLYWIRETLQEIARKEAIKKEADVALSRLFDHMQGGLEEARQLMAPWWRRIPDLLTPGSQR